MEVVIKRGPAELNRARMRIAAAAQFGDAVAVADARREYARQRALALIKFGEEQLATLERADMQ